MKAAGRELPDGWFLYLSALVKSLVTVMPTYGAHEVGAGLFDSTDRAEDALRTRLRDTKKIIQEAKALADKARERLSAEGFLSRRARRPEANDRMTHGAG